LSIILFLLIYNYANREPGNIIPVFSNTLQSLKKTARGVFSNHKVEDIEGSHLFHFLRGTEKVFSYDIEALSLMESNSDYYFYPLYTDVIAIGIDRDQTDITINGFKDLETVSEKISLSGYEPNLRYIWAVLSYSFTGKFQHNTVAQYLKLFEENNQLVWDDTGAPITISFASVFQNRNDEGKNIETIIPGEGTMSFDVGILSYNPIDDNLIKTIKEDYKFLDYSNNGDISEQDYKNIIPAISFKKEFMEFDIIKKYVRRDVLGVRKYSVADDKEHHIISLFLIIIILLWTVQMQKRVIHPGIRKGLLLTGILLIGWIVLGLFKYSIYEYTYLAHISWYLYYLFLLPLPVVSLYIAENFDRVENSHIPFWLKISFAISAFFLVMVLTNDYHQHIFEFLTDVPELRGDEYTYGLAFVIMNVWFTASQLSAFMLMLKKGLDLPKRSRIVLPISVFILGIVYNAMYNLRVPMVFEIPVVLAISTIIISFWAAAVFSGLIPSNKGYYGLFQSSSLHMYIMDSEDNIVFNTVNTGENIPVLEKLKGNKNQNRVCLQHEDKLLWISPISGGKVVMQEDITQLNRLRQTLEETVSALEKENLILSKKERVESRLIFLNERNRLAQEVHWAIKGKLREMEKLVAGLRIGSEHEENIIAQIHCIALYCKRKSELLIKSKDQNILPAQELYRIMQEITIIMPENYTIFCQVDGEIPFAEAALIYESYSIMNEIALKNNIDAMTGRLYRKDNAFFLYIIVEGDIYNYYEELRKIFIKNHKIEFVQKELDGAMSITLKIKGKGNDNVGTV
ncbi:MAG TPA: hypothetical protein VFC70_00915, partial [Oscillospiraceae bacterium]|nr:hypothetical protein [Oscillospiraceae bacterium]